MWQVIFLGLSVLGGLLRRRSLQVWEDAAASSGLRLLVTSRRPLAIQAREGPLEVRIEKSPVIGARVVIVVPGPPGFSAVRIRREMNQSLWKSEIEVGDEAFDSTFFIEGPPPLVCALLDGEARSLLTRVNAKGRLEIVGGRLQADMSDRQVREVLALLLALGRRFAQPLDLERRLAANARGDPEAGVRLRSLLVLVHERPAHPATVEALHTACSDPSPEIRLRAAQELRAEGHNALIELAEGAVDDTWSAQAVSILGRALPFDRANVILTHALRRRRILTARACLESLGRRGGAEAVEILAQVMAREQGELAPAAALALGKTGSTAAEPPLILALQHEHADARTAAASALGLVGTAAAVQPLKEANERSLLHHELRRAARQAIAAIQLRLPGASPGQLSLAGIEAGQLSLAPAEAGQLSLATDPAGQLSLPAREVGPLSLGGGGDS